MKKRLSLVLIISLLLIGTIGVQAQEAGGTLRYGLSTDPSSLDPHSHSGVAAQTIRQCVYNGLVTYYKGTEIIPELAISWENPEPNIWIFNLREGVKFHNGSEFNAEDVKYSFERILDPKTGATLESELSGIEKIEILDEYKIKFELSEPNAAFLSTIGLSEAAIVSKEYMEAGGDLDNDMMGTGPFVFSDRDPGQKLVVEKNNDFFKSELPYLDKIEFIPYSDENTRITALKSSEIDIASYIPWEQMSVIEQDPDLKLHSGPGPFMYLMFNVSKEPLDNPKVRRALGYAIDRQAIINAAFFKRGEPLYGPPVPEDAWFYHEELADYFEFNPEKAKEMLAEAGYPDGFEISITGTSTYGMLTRTTEVIQENLKQIGVDCEIELFDWATTVDKWHSGNYDMISFGTVADPLDPNFYSKFFATGNSHYSEPTGYSDPKVDELLEKGKTTLDRDKRDQIYKELEERLLETSPWVYLTWREQGEATRSYVKGYEHLPSALAFMSSITLREVWLDK